MKSGWKTTEFWATIAANVGAMAAAASGALPVKYAAILASVSVAAYNVSRGLTKTQSTPPVVPVVVNSPQPKEPNV